jgi:hypothetical protein
MSSENNRTEGPVRANDPQQSPQQQPPLPTQRNGSGRFALGAFVGILVVLAITGACVIGYFAQRVQDRFTPPTATPAVETIRIKPPSVQEIQQMADLSTVKYSLTAEISDERVPDDLRAEFGVKEELLLLAYGEVAAGFDLAKMNESDIWVDGTRIQVRLPPPEILYSRLDTERTRVIYYQKSLFMQRDISMEAKSREEAEKAIREAALESEILEQASRYGELFFSNWLRSMGFTEVQVIVG